jgi:hypothetical protein
VDAVDNGWGEGGGVLSLCLLSGRNVAESGLKGREAATVEPR